MIHAAIIVGRRAEFNEGLTRVMLWIEIWPEALLTSHLNFIYFHVLI